MTVLKVEDALRVVQGQYQALLLNQWHRGCVLEPETKSNRVKPGQRRVDSDTISTLKLGSQNYQIVIRSGEIMMVFDRKCEICIKNYP